MDKTTKVINCFKERYNCSQAVLSSFSEELGIDLKHAQKIASAFGGGIARNGETCGAVTGALMVLGLKHWKPEISNDEAKMHVYNMSNRFMKEFKNRNSSVVCKELLGCDLSTDEGRKKMKEENLSEKICEKLLRDSTEILEKMV